jgi:hypothetical protein
MAHLGKRFVITYFDDEQKRPKVIHDILCAHSKANARSLLLDQAAEEREDRRAQHFFLRTDAG